MLLSTISKLYDAGICSLVRTRENYLEHSKLDIYVFYDCQYCINCVIGRELKSLLATKRSGAEIGEIEGLKILHNTPFSSVYLIIGAGF